MAIKVYYGENRLMAEKAIKQALGSGYEVYEGENLVETDLPSIFQGASLFEAGKRRILLKNVSENVAVWEKIADYRQTENEVIVWELKLDKRAAGYKKLKDSGVDLREFADLKKPELNVVFNVLDMALRDGQKAVEMVEQIESQQDSYMFFGLLVTQMLKKYETSGAQTRERKILKELVKTDMLMKSSTIEAWDLVKSFLLRVST